MFNKMSNKYYEFVAVLIEYDVGQNIHEVKVRVA